MKNEIRRIADAAWQIVIDPKANRIERLEALKLVAACKGILLPELNENFLSVRQVLQLRRAKQQIVERVLRQKAQRRKANRKQYVKRQLRELEATAESVGQETHGQDQ
jgi:hypothetical protein